MARKYQHTQELLPKIKEMLEGGMTQKERCGETWGDRRESNPSSSYTKGKGAAWHTEAAWSETAKALAEYKYEKQALENGSRAVAGFSLAHWEGVKISVNTRSYIDTEKSIPSAKCVVFLKYPVAVYYGYVSRMDTLAKDLPLAEKYESVRQRAGTHMDTRVCIWLERKGIHHNLKTILRVMNKYNLLSVIRRTICKIWGRSAQIPQSVEQRFHR